MCKIISDYLGDSYVLTPRIALQRQYADTFKDARKLIGRKWLPCSWKDSELNAYVTPIIEQGKFFKIEERASCSGAICTKKPAAKRKKVLEECAKYGPCPYQTLIDTASLAPMIVANYHSFVAQTKFRPEQFGHRKLLCIDEGHTLAGALRGMLTVGFTICRMVAPKEVEHLKTLQHWVHWLGRSEQLATFDTEEARDAYNARIEQFEQTGEGVYGSPVIAITNHDPEKEQFKVSFVPYNVGGAAQKLVYQFADVVIALSGTWHGKQISCQEIGLDPSLTHYIEVPSDFPAENRPVYCHQGIDLSHKNWETNLPALCNKIQTIMQKHKGVRGLVHASSYNKAWQIAKELKSRRVIVHTAEDFQDKFQEFLDTPDAVLISPSCYEGISLDDDKCRFNILTTLPYPSAAEGYFQRLLANGGWNLYNTICMRQIGQALGRGVRHNQDYCENHLIDERFMPFLKKMVKVLPGWFKEALKVYEGE